MIKVGCCGFPVARKEYFKNFSLVEVQQTFYKPPRMETAFKWRSAAPPEFEFAVKAWQLITHAPSSPTYRKAGIDVTDENNFSVPCKFQRGGKQHQKHEGIFFFNRP